MEKSQNQTTKLEQTVENIADEPAKGEQTEQDEPNEPTAPASTDTE